MTDLRVLTPRFTLPEHHPTRPRSTAAVHQGPIRALVFAGAEHVLSAGEDGAVRLSSTAGAVVRTYAGSAEGAVNALAVIGRGLFATGGDDGVVSLWDLESERPRRILRDAHAAPVRALGGVGTRLVSGGDDGTLCFWDIDTGDLVARVDAAQSVLAIAVEAGRVYAATLDNAIRVFDLETGAALEPLYAAGGRVLRSGALYVAESNEAAPGHRQPPRHLAVTGDGRLISASEELLSWDLGRGDARVLGALHSRCDGLSVTPAGLVALCGIPLFIDPAAGETVAWLPSADASARVATALAVSPDGAWVAVGEAVGTVRVFASSDRCTDLDRHRVPVREVVVSPGGRYLLTNDVHNVSRVWSADDGKPLAETSMPGAGPRRVAFLGADGVFVTSSLHPHPAFAVHRVDGERVAHVTVEGSGPGALAARSDRELLVGVASGPHRWTGESGLSPLEGRSGPVSQLAIAADGALAVSLASFPVQPPPPGGSVYKNAAEHLQCWDLDAGRLQWTVGAPPSDPLKALLGGGGRGFGFVALVDGGVVSMSVEGPPGVTCRDLGSGAVRWTQPIDGRVVGHEVVDGALWLVVTQGAASRVYKLAARDGALQSRVDLAGAVSFQVALVGARDMVATLERGHLVVYDASRGDRVAVSTGHALTALGSVEASLFASTADGRVVAWDLGPWGSDAS